MAQTDARIALMGRGPDFQGFDLNQQRINALAAATERQNMENRVAAQALESNNALRSVLADPSNFGPDGAINVGALAPRLYGAAPLQAGPVVEGLRRQQVEQRMTQAQQFNMQREKFAALRDEMATLHNAPDLSYPMVAQRLQLFTQRYGDDGGQIASELQRMQGLTPEQLRGEVRSAFEAANKIKPQQATEPEWEMLQDKSARGQLMQRNKRTGEVKSIGAGPQVVVTRGGDEPGIKSRAKPMPASALKLQNEELDAIGNFAGTDADVSSLAQQIKNNELVLGPVANTVSRVRNFIGESDKVSRNFATLEASLEKMRNASLLLNKGVQTEGDAQRAWNELFKNLNDKDVVLQRLKEIGAINQRAMQIRKYNVDAIRENYGQEPFDFSRYEKQNPAVGQGGGQSPAAPSRPPLSSFQK